MTSRIRTETRRPRRKAGPSVTQPACRMCLAEVILAQCTDLGMRITEQRRIIVEAVAACDHPDVDEVHQLALERDPRISAATVYRTLKALEEAGILVRHDFWEGRSRYEVATRDHHDHLIDVKSGRVVEFTSEALEELKQQVARELGYELVDHRLELYAVPRDGKRDSTQY